MTLGERIRSVKDHLAYWDKRVRSGIASRDEAARRINHWEDRGRHWVRVWEQAEKEGDRPRMRRAKNKTHRAHRKLKFWLHVHADIKDGLKVAVERRRWQRKKLAALEQIRRERTQAPTPTSTTVTYDGHRVPSWIATELNKARYHSPKLWWGVVVSGVRTTAESIRLCELMCGQPTCPGRCAGASSHHNCDNCGFPAGAVDVTDYWRLQAASRILGLRIHNGLPTTDPVHFSYYGN